MKAFLAYMKWLSTGIPDGAKIVGSGTMAVQEPDRADDLGHGGRVYAEKCAGWRRRHAPAAPLRAHHSAKYFC